MTKLCECGCGQPTRLAPVNDASKGWVKGWPLRYLKGHGFRRQPNGAENHNWRGGRHIDPQGYAVINTGPRQRRREHVVMAEKALGRPLKFISPGHPDNEVVHHIYGDRADNHGEFKLLICTHAYHTALHDRLAKSEAWPEFKENPRNKGKKHG